MAFDINQFSQAFQYNGARPSKFDIQLTVPPALTGIDPGAAAKLAVSCKAASIPPFVLGEIDIPYFGRSIKVPGDRTWQDWRITIMLDQDYTTRALFEAWNNAINRLESNVMQASFDQGVSGYKTNWNITHYALDGGTIRQYQIIGGWPRTVGPIALDWEGKNKISEFEVDVAFDNFAPTADGEQSWVNSTSTTYFPSIDLVG